MNDLIEKIKGYGYWRILIRPNKYDDNLIPSLAEAKKIIEDNKVSLRGWDYPHVDRELKSISKDSIESMCDWKEGQVYEYWRYYLSGQFVHYFGTREDCRIDEAGLEKIKNRIAFRASEVSHVKAVLGILSTLYTFTEVFLFASQLAQGGHLGEDSIRIEITLYKAKDRMLYTEEASRHLSRPYICNFSDDEITMSLDITRADIMANYDELAIENVLEFFRCFEWENPSKQILEEDQRKLLERRL